jgi:hypothetical protein
LKDKTEKAEVTAKAGQGEKLEEEPLMVGQADESSAVAFTATHFVS